MKKITTLFAVGVVALGASAQATEVSSDEYALITIPVVAGDNLIGVSVVADDAKASDLFSGISTTDDVKKYVGGNTPYQTGKAGGTEGALGLDTGDAFWYHAAAAGALYELGVAPPESGTFSYTVAGIAPIAAKFSAPWSIENAAVGDSTFKATSGSKKSTANKIHFWNGTGYTTYWYKNTGDASTSEWKPSTPPQVKAGEGVMVELKTSGAFVITPAAAQ